MLEESKISISVSELQDWYFELSSVLASMPEDSMGRPSLARVLKRVKSTLSKTHTKPTASP